MKVLYIENEKLENVTVKELNLLSVAMKVIIIS